MKNPNNLHDKIYIKTVWLERGLADRFFCDFFRFSFPAGFNCYKLFMSSGCSRYGTYPSAGTLRVTSSFEAGPSAGVDYRATAVALFTWLSSSCEPCGFPPCAPCLEDKLSSAEVINISRVIKLSLSSHDILPVCDLSWSMHFFSFSHWTA